MKLFVSFLLTINKHLIPGSTSEILKVGDFISFHSHGALIKYGKHSTSRKFREIKQLA